MYFSMEECEALCTNIAIMVDGRFQCLGSLQHLKSKYGVGFMVVVTILAPANSKLKRDNGPVKAFMSSTYAGALLLDEHEGMLTYQVIGPDATMGGLFNTLKSNQARLKIEDYTVSQTTLEQIFISFARSAQSKVK